MRARDLAGDGLELCRAWIGIAAGLRVVDRIEEALAALDAAEAAALSHQSLDDLARIHNLRRQSLLPLSRLAECRAAHEQSRGTPSALDRPSCRHGRSAGSATRSMRRGG
ncbi:MAG: hypothetical protein U1E53_21260 [Dongiaceae bacterium]